NTSESLNLLAYCLSDSLKTGDEIVTTIVEHHSNFVPWQQLAIRKKLLLKVVPLNAEKYLDFQTEQGEVDDSKIGFYVNKNTKIVALTHISNVLGTVYPIEKIIKVIKRINPLCIVIVDGAQSVGHMPVDVKKLNADYFAFSGHKMMGPTGVGVLYGRADLLETLPPFLFGGEMIREVHLNRTIFNSIPHKFEAGTPAIAEAIGLGEAVKVLNRIGMDAIKEQEHQLVNQALTALRENIKGLTVLGPDKHRSGIVSFTLEKIHPHDIAQVLAEDGICVRAGHHCAMPLHESMQIEASTRASFYTYNNQADISQLITSLQRVYQLFNR
ncbi:cysteine desulfurase, partial [Candidatus Roizmanbacteria bacterium CG_4_10_14_0_8_um_filter_39_9]